MNAPGEPTDRMRAGIGSVRCVPPVRHLRGETGTFPGVAGGPRCIDTIQHRVPVTIESNFSDSLDMARCRAFLPQRPPGPAEIVSQTTNAGLLEGLPVCVGDH